MAPRGKHERRGPARSCFSLTIPLDQEPFRSSLDLRFGAMADALLLSEGLVTNEESRRKLIETLARDLTNAAEKLARNADGDYSPDTCVERFPEVVARGEADGSKRTSLGEFIDAWYASALDRRMRPRGAKQWRSVLLRFKDWLGHDDLRRIALRDVQTWGNERNAQGIKAKTINDTYFAALKAAFDWGRRAGWVELNPAADARIDGRDKTVSRDKFFSEEEVAALLQAAQMVEGSSREHPTTTAAKRWIPWLLAYSGARVSELIQLRKQDIRQEGDTWVMRLTPDAGAIKTNTFRDVPLHGHLIELGFIDFLSQGHTGPLFCQADAKGNIAGSAEGVYSRIRMSVRKVVPDPTVQPNHAWRYTFKSRGFEAGIEAHTLDAICGHGPQITGRGVYIR